MSQRTPIRDDFPDTFYPALARLVVAFGRVEYIVKLTIKSLLDQGFTPGMTKAESLRAFRDQCKQAKRYADEKLPSEQAETYGKLLDCALALAEQRNDHVHALWTTEDGQPKRYRLYYDTNKKALGSRNRVVTPEELDRTAAEMQSLVDEIQQMRKTWDAPQP